MGAIVAHLTGTLAKRNWPDASSLIAAGAGAGLAAAFNAPTAGAVFVLEELVRRFEPRMAIAALAASTGRDLRVAHAATETRRTSMSIRWLSPAPPRSRFTVALGAVAGLSGGRLQPRDPGAIAAANDLRRWPLELRAGAIGARSARWHGSRPTWSAAATRSRSARSMAAARSPCAARFSCFASDWARYRMRRARRAACSRRSWSSARSSDYASACLCRMAFPELDIAPEGFAVGRHGGLLRGRGARPVDRHHSRGRDDRQRHRCCCRCWGHASWRCWCRPCCATPPFTSLREQGLRRDAPPLNRCLEV